MKKEVQTIKALEIFKPKSIILETSTVPMPNTEKLASGILELVESVFKSLEDGKLGVTDLVNFLDFQKYSDVINALSKDRPEMVKELAESTNQSFNAMIDIVKQSFEIKQKEDEQDIENFVIAILSALRIIARKKMESLSK